MNYVWPGNVRELENVLERSMLNCSNEMLRPEHLPITVTAHEINNLSEMTELHDSLNILQVFCGYQEIWYF